MDNKINSGEMYRDKLSQAQYRVLFEKDTEPAFTGEYYDHYEQGSYRCAACGKELFGASAKFHSRSGWPSFYEPVHSSAVEEYADNSHGMTRIEVVCANCGGHLGHVFPDGPAPTGLRYCINSLSLDFIGDQE